MRAYLLLSVARLLQYTARRGAQPPDRDDARPAPLNHSRSTKPPPRQNTCRSNRINEPGAMMRKRIGK
ncbi:hypothetical protein, partial [Caballeronia humi]|uniref:hypothetical protein n=1 Tax=Caballeronia humi TaxID=326474 RepID=UPI000AB3A9F3